MEKISTAKDVFFRNTGKTINQEEYSAMIEFAKMHTELALKEANEKVTCIVFYEEWEDNELKMDEDNEEGYYKFPFIGSGKIIIPNSNSILNSYPLENIK